MGFTNWYCANMRAGDWLLQRCFGGVCQLLIVEFVRFTLFPGHPSIFNYYDVFIFLSLLQIALHSPPVEQWSIAPWRFEAQHRICCVGVGNGVYGWDAVGTHGSDFWERWNCKFGSILLILIGSFSSQKSRISFDWIRNGLKCTVFTSLVEFAMKTTIWLRWRRRRCRTKCASGLRVRMKMRH